MSDVVCDAQTFAQLAIDPRIVEAVTTLGFEAPTPIQARAIPPLLEGRDLIGRARTGSGKTAAFGLPLIEMLGRGNGGGSSGGGVGAIVLAPTRELALQITTALRSYASGLRLRMVTLYGGAAYAPQLSALRRGVDVVVGTPGRVLDHIGRKSLDLSSVRFAVVDEADEMLRMGFVEDLEKILAATPQSRQVALFSATMPAPIRKVAQAYLREPLEVQVEQRRMMVEHIEQVRIDVPHGRQVDVLVRVLKAKAAGATLIFARTRASCDELAEALRDRGFDAQPLHGNMSQAARESVLGALRTRRVELVVATDVAARGIDVEHLTHVINFDMPDEAEVYVNRIGRTGRAGRKGMAISLVTRRDLRLLRRIEQRLRTRIALWPVPSDADIVARQRAELEGDLGAALNEPAGEHASALVRALLDRAADVAEVEGDEAPGDGDAGEARRSWTADELAAAALSLLMRDRHLDIEAEPSEQPPEWTRPQRRPPRRSERRPDRHDRAPREPKTPRDRAAADEATLGAAVGRAQGIGPSDVVGALANELGVPSRSIGRITVRDHYLTVGLSQAIADELARNPKTVFLRGHPVTFTPARTKPARPARPAGRERDRVDTSARPEGGRRAARPPKPSKGAYVRHPDARKRSKSSTDKKFRKGRQGPVRNKKRQGK